MEQAYSVFADYYDRMTQDVDYPARAAYVRALFDHFGLNPHSLLDLACGTGSMAIEMAHAGFDVTGVDLSPQMLSKATEKTGSTNGNILYICQDICELDLYGTVDAAICCLDSLNHLAGPQKLQQAFNKVSLFLNPGGFFIFDLNTEYKLSKILGNNTFVYDYGEDDLYCIWQNTYRSRTKTCRFDLTFFLPDHGRYRRYDESFSERAYSGAQVEKMLLIAGLKPVGAFKEITFDNPDEQTERIFYVAQKI